MSDDPFDLENNITWLDVLSFVGIVVTFFFGLGYIGLMLVGLV